MERGGGELADHVEAGLTKDISEPAKDAISKIGGSVAGWQVDGKTYALPFSLGVVGFWYNKPTLREGRHHDPADHDGRVERRHRQAQGGRHRRRSPSARVTSGRQRTTGTTSRCASARKQVLQDAVKTLDFSDPCFVKAGEDVQKLIGTDPFNKGFLSTPAQTGPTSASGPARHRQGRDGDAGPLGARCDAGPDRRQARAWARTPAGSRSRLSTAARATRAPRWAAATPGPWPKDAPDAAVDFVKYLLSRQGAAGLRGARHGPADQPGRGQLGQGPGPRWPAQGPRRGPVRAAVLRHRLRCSPSAAR